MASSAQNLDSCRLCESEKVLRNSHIIPEFVYKEIYDEKHRMIQFPVDDLDANEYIQKGLREYLLCDDCERLLNDKYEKPFFQYWYEGNALAAVENNEAAILQSIDYKSFKLFHLSVLYRAAVASHRAFWQVNLGPHEAVIRKMLLHGDPGDKLQYPIGCTAIYHKEYGLWRAFVASPSYISLLGHKGYLFTFSGCGWIYLVSSHKCLEISNLVLDPSGLLPIQRRKWLAFPHIRDHLRRSGRGVSDRSNAGARCKIGR